MNYDTEHDFTARQRKRKFDDEACSIDHELQAARERIDWTRRNAAEKSLAEWVRAYCVPSLLADPPPEKGVEVLDAMQESLTAHGNRLILMPRGSGKTSYCEAAILFALATGLHSYVVLISNSARGAQAIM